MYLIDFLRGLLRRWYILFVGLLLTLIGTGIVAAHVPPAYEAQASLLLLPPDESLEVEGSNPFLMLGGMGQALAVLQTRLNAPESQSALLPEDDPDAAFSAIGDTSTGAPFLMIAVTATSDDTALELLDDVQSAAATQLIRMQSELDIDDSSTIGMMTVTTAAEATIVTSARTQTIIISGVVGIVLTLAAAAIVEGTMSARRRASGTRTPDAGALGTGSAGTGSGAPRARRPVSRRRPGIRVFAGGARR